MKKLVLLSIILVGLFSCKRNQNLNLAQFYQKYQSESTVSMNLPAFLGRIAVNDPEVKKYLRQVKSVQLLVVEKENLTNKRNIRYDLLSALKNDSYDELLNVHSDEDFVSIRIQERNDKIRRLIIAVDAPDETVLINARVNTSIDEISSLIKEMEADGKVTSKELKQLF